MGVEQDCVSSTPKLFVGQVPTESTRDDISALFQPYGKVCRIDMLIPKQGTQSTRSAMVWFEKWTQVEAALEASEAGKVFLDRAKKLVVRIADPPKKGDNINGIKPKKLFIGQIPKDISDSELENLFKRYGEVLEFEKPKKLNGSVTGCAFVRYGKWKEAENAIAELNEKHRFPDSRRPLVVKFADAKPIDPLVQTNKQVCGSKRLLTPDHPLSDTSHLKRYGGCIERCRPSPLDLGYVSSRMGAPMGLGSLIGMGLPCPVDDEYLDVEEEVLAKSIVGGLLKRVIKMMNGMSTPCNNSQSHIDYAMKGMRVQNSYNMTNASTSSDAKGVEIQSHFDCYYDKKIDSYLDSNDDHFQGLIGSSIIKMLNSLPPVGPNGKLGKGISDPRYKEWTLFVGQISHQADEYSLWELFAMVGEILELNILRKDGKHKGCAFITYEEKSQAEEAIRKFNGCSFPWDADLRKLVVRFREKTTSCSKLLPTTAIKFETV